MTHLAMLSSVSFINFPGRLSDSSYEAYNEKYLKSFSHNHPNLVQLRDVFEEKALYFANRIRLCVLSSEVVRTI